MDDKVRIDKWLWAARFFKTRSAAALAVTGGLVHLNGNRVKPSKNIDPGDTLEIMVGAIQFVVVVQGLAEKRGPASIARTLYEETVESLACREKNRELKKLLQPVGQHNTERPSKRDRRLIRHFIRNQE